MNKPDTTNYQLVMERQLAALPKGERLLLHACCAPCASAVIERLAPHFAITLFYYNPNIAPGEEYARRGAELERLASLLHTPYPLDIAPVEWRPEDFAAAAQGLEAEPEGGRRCTRCFALRLAKTAEMAAELGIPWFTTTLTVSPHKNAPLINEAGREAAARCGPRFLPSDFKKKNGYRRSIALSNEFGLYRQNYCGCAYSLRDAR